MRIPGIQDLPNQVFTPPVTRPLATLPDVRDMAAAEAQAQGYETQAADYKDTPTRSNYGTKDLVALGLAALAGDQGGAFLQGYMHGKELDQQRRIQQNEQADARARQRLLKQAADVRAAGQFGVNTDLKVRDDVVQNNRVIGSENVANIGANTKVTTTGMNNTSKEGIEAGKNDTTIKGITIKTGSNEKIAGDKNATTLKGIGMKTGSNEKIAKMKIDANAPLVKAGVAKMMEEVKWMGKLAKAKVATAAAAVSMANVASKKVGFYIKNQTDLTKLKQDANAMDNIAASGKLIENGRKAAGDQIKSFNITVRDLNKQLANTTDDDERKRIQNEIAAYGKIIGQYRERYNQLDTQGKKVEDIMKTALPDPNNPNAPVNPFTGEFARIPKNNHGKAPPKGKSSSGTKYIVN